jgi:ATP-dependent RNA helicase SUPV3L1/SUV3
VKHELSPPAAEVLALLGPTNTGKTHRAIERMLEFSSGMMGLPLRLLAREVYDRVSTRLGEQAVALVTGEEKRVPPRARFFVCTVEAMPRDLNVEFMAIDEVQLMAHPERGHVFTERVLGWRGSMETWFLGSSTVERLLRELIPGLRVRRLPRLSTLTHIGQSSLRTLPRRSAVVAFSLPQVYELADALRARRGGAAVVLGALSPRVRNAQVALFQAGEVDFLVATDAIGMGLNLDIEHVALSSRIKFDGFETRELSLSEMAQIVGRAGRHLRDGTFGTLSPEPELSPALAERLEQHRFPPLTSAFYRNAELDFASVSRLLSSLEQRAPQRGLVRGPDADDLLLLRVLAKKPEVMALASDERRIRLLWDVCRIPNYEKRIPEHQAERIWPLFAALARAGELPRSEVERELSRLARFEGDIHQLMDRLASVRTWAYVSNQPGWVDGAEALRLSARELEDKLGDLLHTRLLERFVMRATRVRRRSQAVSAHTDSGPFAKLRELDMFNADEREKEREETAWVEALIDASFADLALSARGELTFRGQVLGRLKAGPTLLRPALRLELPDWVPPGSRGRLERRLIAHIPDLVAHVLEPLAFTASASAPVRGLGYQLEQALGTSARKSAEPQLQALSQADRALLEQRGVILGRYSVFAREMLTSERRHARFALVRAFAPEPRKLDQLLPMLDEPCLSSRFGLDSDTLLSLGFVPMAGFALRCDVLETVVRELPRHAHAGRLPEVRALLGCNEELAARVLSALTRTRKRRKRRPPAA